MRFKCVKCGRVGLFAKLTEDGLCQQCEAERQRQIEKQKQIEEAERIEKERREQEYQRRYQEKVQYYENMISRIAPVEVSISPEPAKIILLKDQPEIKFSSVTSKSSVEKLGNFVVVDVETTGLQPSKCEIIDLAAIRFRNFIPVEKFTTLLSSKKPIPSEAQMVNGITDAMIQGKPRFQHIAVSFLDFIGKDNLVGHNLGFDLDFIVRYGADVSLQKRKYYDTLDIARKTIKKQKMKWDRELEFYYPDEDDFGIENYKLETLCDWYGIWNMDSHRAEGDALATGLLFKNLVNERIGI